MFHVQVRSFISTVITAALVVGSTALPAYAGRSVPAFAGRAPNASDAGCFAESFGTQTNICGDAKLYIVPLPIDVNGSYTAVVSAFSAGWESFIKCGVYSNNKDNTAQTSFPWKNVDRFNAPSEISLPFSVPSDGVAWVGCWVWPGGRLNSVRW